MAGGTRINRGLRRRRLCRSGPSPLALLVALVLLIGAWLALPLPAQAWALPGRSAASPPAGLPQALGGLQEVAPPAAVQQLVEALAPRQPRITILEPRDGALMPQGTWTLRLGVEDWPLVDAGSLGLGPHLMVQLDDGLPQPLLETTATMPSLGPGSHLLTVYAVRPWGEVVKAPGAFRQIRLHRVAANPLALPTEGSPQLLAVTPSQAIAGEPVLLDWLLIDAPLQNLRADDARWRLRVTVNGDSFLVNQQIPLWLKGWKPGRNAVLIELVDGRGEPLNPPFNSLVREVLLEPGSPHPAWLGPRLDAPTLARLLGEMPAIEPDAPPQPVELPESAAGPSPLPESPEPPRASESSAPFLQGADPAQNQGSAGQASPEEVALAEPLPSPPSELDWSAPDANRPTESEVPPPLQTPSLPLPDAPLIPSSASQSPSSIDDGGLGSLTTGTTSEGDRIGQPSQAPDGSQPAGAAEQSLAARDEVDDDGRLIRPARRSPLQALRERFAR